MATEAVTTFDATGKQIAQVLVEVPAEVTNLRTIEAAAATALASNRTFLAIASPTNAQVSAQVKALTQQNVRLIRLALGLLDGTD
jgi:hypothetical protein